MIELPVLIENIIEIVNVAIEMMLVFLYFSLLSKAKVNKAVLYLSYLLSTVILSATVLLTDNILVYLITTIILISSMSFICYDDSIRHKIFWNILFLLIISISEPIVIGLLCIANMGTPDEFLESGLGCYLGMVGTNIIYLWLIGLMHRIINKKIRELPIKYWILIIVIPIISLMEEREKLFIVITNTSDKVDTSVLTSTKKEQGLHGIGINSIKSSVDRLGGLVSFDYDDGIFKLNIMVRNCLQI